MDIFDYLRGFGFILLVILVIMACAPYVGRRENELDRKSNCRVDLCGAGAADSGAIDGDAAMNTGLLWYDDSPGRDLAEKVGQAARRYRKKFSVDPDVCYVHPSALSDGGKVQKVGGVRVSSRPSVLRHHFWIGREEEKKGEKTNVMDN